MLDRFYVPSFHFNTQYKCYCGSQQAFGKCCASSNREQGRPNSIAIVPNFLDRDSCQSFVSYAERQDRSWLTVNDSRSKSAGKQVWKRSSNRITERVHLGVKQKLIEQWVAAACKQYLPDSLAPQWFETPQLLRYGVGGKYGMHSDAENFCRNQQRFYRFIDRDFSMLIYPNDDYEGGGLYFKGLNFRYQPKAGDLVIFPSNHVFSHESLPVERGTKYAIVTWGVFQGTPRVAPPRQTIALN